MAFDSSWVWLLSVKLLDGKRFAASLAIAVALQSAMVVALQLVMAIELQAVALLDFSRVRCLSSQPVE